LFNGGLAMAKTKEKETKSTIEVVVAVPFWYQDRMVKKGEVLDLTEDDYKDCLDNNLIERG